MNDAAPAVSIVITTHNRLEELRRALRSSVAQQGATCEVLVVDDGSTDGTAEAVRAEFPSVLLERREVSRGYIVRRNDGARLARGAVIVSIDDDAEFSSPRAVERTLADFDDPRIGAVAMPFVNVLQSPEVHQHAPRAEGCFVTDTFIGTAHALRRDLFLKLGGYREELVHQGEERDFCLRLLAAGSVVRLGRAEPILHHESFRRDWRRMDFFGRRNDALFAWHNVPLPHLPVHLAATVANGVRTTLHAHHPVQMLAGVAAGVAMGARDRLGGWTRPVPVAVYRLHRRLKTGGPVLLPQIEPALLPMRTGPGT
jgi:glycosyltransferase involved in cell wall biosynthesis